MASKKIAAPAPSAPHLARYAIREYPSLFAAAWAIDPTHQMATTTSAASTAASKPATRSDTPQPQLPPELRGPLQRQIQVDPAAEAASLAKTKADLEALAGDAVNLVTDAAAAVATHDIGKASDAVVDALKVVRDVEVVAECDCSICLGWASWRHSTNAVQKPTSAEGAAAAASVPAPPAPTAAAAAASAAPPQPTLASPGSSFSFLK